MNGAKILIFTLLFWTILGGLLQFADVGSVDNPTLNPEFRDSNLTSYAESGDTDVSETSVFGEIFKLYTFDIEGIPNGLRVSILGFFSFMILIGAWVLLPSWISGN